MRPDVSCVVSSRLASRRPPIVVEAVLSTTIAAEAAAASTVTNGGRKEGKSITVWGGEGWKEMFTLNHIDDIDGH